MGTDSGIEILSVSYSHMFDSTNRSTRVANEYLGASMCWEGGTWEEGRWREVDPYKIHLKP
jgi:hypothetical protein